MRSRGWKGVEPFVTSRTTFKSCCVSPLIHKPIIPTNKVKGERGSHITPHHNKWNFHCGPTILKINPLSFRDRSEPPQPISMRGDELPLLTVKTKVASDYSWRHPMTYIRCQSHVILGLSDGAASPLPYPPTRTIILKGHPVSLSEAIAFNSHRENLLTV